MAKTFGYSFNYFLDSSRQLATKRIGHKKFWNIMVHVLASWCIAWALLYLGGQYLPFYFQLLLVICKLLICIIQEPPFGFAYAILYGLCGYHAVMVASGVTFVQAVLIVLVGFVIQLVSHLVFEGTQSLERYTKGEDPLFQFCDHVNEFLFVEFHLTLLLTLRLGLLPVLQWRSDVDLRKALDKIHEIKHGRKAP